MASTIWYVILVLAAVASSQLAIATTIEGDYNEFSQQAGEYNQPATFPEDEEFSQQAVAEGKNNLDNSQITEAASYDKQYGLTPTKPGKSCHDIYQLNPASHGNSGYYVILTNRPNFVYCDMTLECGGEKGWMRVANVNGSCPNGWKKITSPTTACRPPSDNAGCYSTHFSTHGVPYRRVCGMAIGYQKGTPDAFQPGLYDISINDPYFDGLSITYGLPRKHIWSYGVGYREDSGDNSNCPCSRQGTTPPSFVRDHYYCESGSNYGSPSRGTYFTSDPVWDGKGCSSRDNCCTQPNMPWFYRQIPLTSHKDLEARVCYNEPFANEGVLVKELQLYVQ